MRPRLAMLLLLAAIATARADEALLLGADLSSLDDVTAAGAVFRSGGEPADPLELMREAGLGWARLRLWHTPKDGRDSLEAVIAQAGRLKAAGFDLLLDLHLSDGWADPAHQRPPRAWHGISGEQLGDSLRAYVSRVLRAFDAAACLPGIVQLGNEIDAGLLWPHGYLPAEGMDSDFTDGLAELLIAARAGVRDAAGDSVRVMLHLSHSTDAARCLRFCKAISRRGVEFDLLGLSYYPWWHGEMKELAASLAELGAAIPQALVIVETAYPRTLDWVDDTHNLVGEESQLHVGYPASPEGQRAFLGDLLRVIRRNPRALGLFYWEPAWIASPGGWAGSPWENCALFDENGEPLPGLAAFKNIMD